MSLVLREDFHLLSGLKRNQTFGCVHTYTQKIAVVGNKFKFCLSFQRLTTLTLKNI